MKNQEIKKRQKMVVSSNSEESQAIKLINWNELSRILSGSKQNVRRLNTPNIYKEKVDGLIKILTDWIKIN